MIKTKHACLENWKTRRQDKKMEAYWARIEAERPFNIKYQQEWNFRETDYNDTPSNNGLDPSNPAFAFTTNLHRYIVIKDVET